ncbi:hypothetical protein BH10PSE12_BH10PSE12_29790 [soil metagenome]
MFMTEEYALRNVPIDEHATVMKLRFMVQTGGPLASFFQSIGTQAAIVLINLVTGVLTARLLGAEGRGIFAAVTVWPQMFALVAISGIGNAVVFRLNKSPAAAPQIVTATLLSGVIASMVAVAIGVCVMPFALRRYDADTVLLAQLCLGSVFINALQMLIKQSYAGLGAFGWFSIANLSSQLAYLLCLLVLVIFVPLTAKLAILALVGSSVLGLLVLLPSFVRLARPRLKGVRREFPSLLSYSWRSAGFDLITALSNNADRLILIPLLAAKSLGLYAVAYSFSRLIQLALPAIASVLFSTMTSLSRAEAKLLHDRTYRFMFATLTIGCIGMWIAGPFIMRLVYGEEFAPAATIFRILVLEAALGVLTQVTIQLFMSLDRPGIISSIQAIVMVATLIALFFLVPAMGTLGAATGLLLAAVLRLVLLYGAVRGTLKFEWPRPYLNRSDFDYLRSRFGIGIEKVRAR